MSVKIRLECTLYMRKDGELHRAEFRRDVTLPAVPEMCSSLWGALTNVDPRFKDPLTKGAHLYALYVRSIIMDALTQDVWVWVNLLPQRPKEPGSLAEVLAGPRLPEFIPDEEWVGKYFSQSAWQRTLLLPLKHDGVKNVDDDIDDDDDDYDDDDDDDAGDDDANVF